MCYLLRVGPRLTYGDVTQGLPLSLDGGWGCGWDPKGPEEEDRP